jgi:CHAT domain-containing protein
VPKTPKAFVAADVWHGARTLDHAHDEAAAIAAIYRTTPVLYRTTGSATPQPNPDVVERVRAATLVHLACHGVVDGTDLSLLLGGAVSLHQFLGADASMLPGRPLVVLSACELGGFTGENIPAEQYGFPAGLLAIGARAVVGALWPMPDAPATIRIMESFHRHLADLPSNAALPEAIAQARREHIPAMFWASLAHFGV